jgi:hypothetical protein
MAKRRKPQGESNGKINIQKSARTRNVNISRRKPAARVRTGRGFRKIQKVPDEQDEQAQITPEPSIERFDKAFLISLGLIALFSLLVFIPILGPLLLLTLVPYLSCNIGCKYVSKRNGVQVGLLIGILWSIIEFNLIVQFLNQIKIAVGEAAITTNLDLFLIVLIFIANIVLCMIGGYTGGAKFEMKELKAEIEELVKKPDNKKTFDVK